MQIEETALPGVVIVTPKRLGDGHGWFSETGSAVPPLLRDVAVPFEWILA